MRIITYTMTVCNPGLKTRWAIWKSNMEDEYSQLEPALAQSDGKANAALIETIIANQEKARIAAMTLHKLLSFMSNSTMRMQETDMGIGSIGDGFSIRGRKEGGD